MADEQFHDDENLADQNVEEDGGSILPGSHEEDEAGRSKDRRSTRRVLLIFAGLLAIILIAVVAVGGWYASRVNKALDKIERAPSMMPTGDSTAVAPTPAQADYKTPMTIVLIGSDSRGPDQGRSDVLMTAYVPGNRKHVYLTSYPRDLWVPIPRNPDAKINAAYAWGGPSLTVETLQNYTGVKMDHVALINFEKFMMLTETLGGVTVNNKVASTSANKKYTWPRGKITIKGEEALTYVRQRKELPNGDLDRAERQRAVVQAIIDKLVSRDVISNPKKFDENAQALAGAVTVDDDMSNKVLRSLATSMRIKSGADIISFQAPITGFGWSADKQSIALADKENQKKLNEAMKNDTMDEFWAKNKDECSFSPNGC